jgi:NAD kinase
MTTNSPRVVFVTRETEYELLIARHATKDQARFFLETRGQKLIDVENRHHYFQTVMHDCRAAVRSDWRQTILKRSDFDRFLFGPEDIIVALGQDGLVANIAKYLDGQPVIGVNPDPEIYDGVLVRFSPSEFCKTFASGKLDLVSFDQRAMVKAELDNGEKLLALNEIFIGHSSHQSARYQISVHDNNENHSSSGLIVASGTGATGWARSMMEAAGINLTLPSDSTKLGYFVREPFPSVSTGTSIRFGVLEQNEALTLTSRMNEGGAIFADGIEKDNLSFDWGRIVRISVAEQYLKLAVP